MISLFLIHLCHLLYKKRPVRVVPGAEVLLLTGEPEETIPLGRTKVVSADNSLKIAATGVEHEDLSRNEIAFF